LNKQSIQKELLYLGVKPSLKGFEYITTAIELYKPTNKMMDIYQAIAIKYKTTADRVERAIRHAKELMLEDNILDLENRFKERYKLDIFIPDKFTNGDFIALMKIATDNV